MTQGIVRRTVTAAGVMGVLLLGVAVTPAAADSDTDVSDADWYAMADDATAEVEATDWAAVSAEDGCRLVDVEIDEVVDAGANAAMGAPADLAVPVVEREEVCGGLTSDRVSSAESRTAGSLDAMVSRGSDCSWTSGPGYLCVSRSGSYVTTSFRYDGSSTIKAFLKLYRISTSASGCPTGSTLATSSTNSYGDGTRRSLTVYAPSYGGYSSHVWRYVGFGVYNNWGSACGVL